MSIVPLVLGRGSNPGVIRAEDQPPGEDDSLRGFFAATREGMIPTLSYQADARGDDLLWAPRRRRPRWSRVVEAVRPDAVVVDHLAFSATLALRAAGIDYADVVLGHPTALPVDGEVYGEALAWPSAFHPEPAAVAALRERCLAVRERFTESYNDALQALASERVAGRRRLRCARSDGPVQLPGGTPRPCTDRVAAPRPRVPRLARPCGGRAA